MPDGQYFASEPIKGDENSVDIGQALVPIEAEGVGIFHTHGNYSESNPETGKPVATGDKNRDDYNSDMFSGMDMFYSMELAESWGNDEDLFASYLGTPSGRILKYTPEADGLGIDRLGTTEPVEE